MIQAKDKSDKQFLRGVMNATFVHSGFYVKFLAYDIFDCNVSDCWFP